MCRWFSEKIDDDKELLNVVWFLDEAHFPLNGHVDSKNLVFRESENPYSDVGCSLNSKKCTAWIAISKHDIIRPSFFKDDHDNAITATKESYIPVLQLFWGKLEKTTLIKKNSDSSKIVLLTLLMSPSPGSVKRLGSVLSAANL